MGQRDGLRKRESLASEREREREEVCGCASAGMMPSSSPSLSSIRSGGGGGSDYEACQGRPYERHLGCPPPPAPLSRLFAVPLSWSKKSPTRRRLHMRMAVPSSGKQKKALDLPQCAAERARAQYGSEKACRSIMPPLCLVRTPVPRSCELLLSATAASLIRPCCCCGGGGARLARLAPRRW